MTVAAAGMAASAVSASIWTTEMPLPPIEFSYNPEHGLNLTYTAHYKSTPQPGSTTGRTQQQYRGNAPTKVTVDIYLDAFAVPPMPPMATIETLRMYLAPNPITLASTPKPPTVTFSWGANIVMEAAVVTNVTVVHERFLLGIPIRTKATVELTDAAQFQLPGTNPTSGALATRKTHTVVEGDTLASVAYKEYGDPNRWRALAIANGIDDPMRVKAGTELIVPDKRDADALTA